VFDICRPVFCVRTGDVEMGGDKGMNLFQVLIPGGISNFSIEILNAHYSISISHFIAISPYLHSFLLKFITPEKAERYPPQSA
jgi:hypothetical protein